MGFEDMDEMTPKKEGDQGFETSGIELGDGLVAQARPVRPSRRKKHGQPEVKSGIKTEEETSGTGTGEEPARRKMKYTPSLAHPRVMKENSEFGYLFSDDEPVDTHMTSAFAGKLDGLAYDEKQDGEGEKYDEIFAQTAEEPMVRRGFNSRSKKDRGASSDSDEQKSESRPFFSRHSKKKDKKDEEPEMDTSNTNENQQITEPEELTDEEVAAAAYPYPPQPYPYGQPYPQYPQYPYQQPAYPPQYPYAQPYPPQYPYAQPYPQYPQYPYQQPAYPYPPQPVIPVIQPVGYIYQPGAQQPVAPQVRRRKPASARSNARRYGQLPYEDQIPAEAKQEEAPAPQPVQSDFAPAPEPQEKKSPLTYDPYPPALSDRTDEPQPKVEPLDAPPETPAAAPAPEHESRFNRHSHSDNQPAAPQDNDHPGDEGKPKFNRRTHSGDDGAAASGTADGGESKSKFNRRKKG